MSSFNEVSIYMPSPLAFSLHILRGSLSYFNRHIMSSLPPSLARFDGDGCHKQTGKVFYYILWLSPHWLLGIGQSAFSIELDILLLWYFSSPPLRYDKSFHRQQICSKDIYHFFGRYFNTESLQASSFLFVDYTLFVFWYRRVTLLSFPRGRRHIRVWCANNNISPRSRFLLKAESIRHLRRSRVSLPNVGSCVNAWHEQRDNCVI